MNIPWLNWAPKYLKMVLSRGAHAVKNVFKRVGYQRNIKSICQKSDAKRLNCCQVIGEHKKASDTKKWAKNVCMHLSIYW